ncbi:HAD-hyrolase-like [Austwickia chelonae]|nr:HAD-hyrolase-like [Austwickia chelonae]
MNSADAAGGRKVAAVLQGYGREVNWADLAEAAYAIAEGAIWVASNTDLTIPTARGIAPGNGSLVGAVRQAVAIDPFVVGKPQTALYELSASVLGGALADTLAVGDRLDTDIEGANKTGIDSLFVLTGVNDIADVVMAPTLLRPRYIASDLRALSNPYEEPAVQCDRSQVTARCTDAEVVIAADGTMTASGEPEAAMRAFVSAAWKARDTGLLADEKEVRHQADAVQIAAQRAAQD